MIGFSLEFKRWYLVVRGPKGNVYSAFGFAKQMPVFTPTKTMTLQEYMEDTMMRTYSPTKKVKS
jgi:hypothetical protein